MERRPECFAIIYFGLGYAAVMFPDSSLAGPSNRVVLMPNGHTDRFPLDGIVFVQPIVIRWDVWERITNRISELSFDRLLIRQAIGDRNIEFLLDLASDILEEAYQVESVESAEDPYPGRLKGWNSKIGGSR